MDTRTPTEPISRSDRKRQTREEIMRSALELLEDKSFTALSLREVARGAGVVPTAFYRHFESMDELGLALVEESFGTLKKMLRSARDNQQSFDHVIRSSVEILVRQVRANHLHFRFLMRERFGGSAVVRQAINNEIRFFQSELATDIARFPYLNEWRTEDLHVAASLIVNVMVSASETVLSLPLDRPEVEAEAIHTTERQLLLIALGISQWRSS